MLPDPLHPAVVHFPIALVVLLPMVAVVALWVIRRGAPARRVWVIPVAFAGMLVVSSWVALQTGEAEEDRVEAVVAERALHEHEEAAERFMTLSGVLFLVAAAGLAGGTLGRAGRLLTTAGAVGLVFLGVQVGAAGGELVYQHGAADAYVGVAGRSGVAVEARNAVEDDD